MDKCCTRCEQVKPLTEYDRSGRSGKMSYCKECRREERRVGYVPHPKPLLSVDPGQRFGRLEVLAETTTESGPRRVACICDCGNQVNVRLHSLLKGETKSCGCYHRELAIQRNRSAKQREHTVTHGMTGHPLYGTWQAMIARCENQAHQGFRNYGERGITVCAEWHDPAVFVAWIEANLGPRPEGETPGGSWLYSLDRENNDRGYEPGNMRWATRSQQRRNRRRA